MALGATRGNILGLITSDALRMVAIGTYDPLTFIAVPVVLTLVALVAILMPARAGSRVGPAVTLRAE